MSKFSIDYDNLSNNINKTVYKLSEVKHKIQKIAFDIVRFTDDDTKKLWQVQSADDGDYIVCLYDNKEATNNSSNWEVVSNKMANDLSLFYKGEPIIKISASKLGINKEELDLVKKYLPEKLASNKNLTKSLLKDMDEKSRQDILRKYPELNK